MFPSLALIPLYAAADRLWGAKHPAFTGKKGLILAAAVGVGALYGPALALMGLVWFAYRSQDFAGGAGAPCTGTERLAALGRHMLIVPIPLLVLGLAGRPVAVAAGVLVAYAITATSLAIWNGKTDGRHNHLVELLRGAAFGAALAASHILQPG